MSEFCDRISSLDVISFDKIIGTAAALIPPDQLPTAKARVSGGIRLFNSEFELNDYLVAFGEIHRAKLMEFLPSIPFQECVDTGLILVDWGCGQGVASAVTLDYLRSRSYQVEICAVRLIELVKPALNRALGIVNKYQLPSSCDVLALEWDRKGMDSLCEDLPEGVPVLHLFSNILDVVGLDIEGIRETVEKMRGGRRSYVLSVGPDMVTKRSSPPQLLDFLKSFERPQLLHVYPNSGTGRIYGNWKYWPYAYCKCYGFAYALSPIEVQPIIEPPVAEVGTAPQSMPVTTELPSLLPPDPEDIFMYASAGMLEELESLIKAGVDVDYRNEKGASALYFAAKHGNLLCVRSLVKAGANVELGVFGTRMTPYLIAVKYERLDVMKELAESGCDVFARDHKGRGAADIARVYGLGEAVVTAVESISKGTK
ncbi:MAG: ankyrin repeat domain-containing protein [Lentisphaerae bacterium]|nr:ankyrin repeat domain-containing protein [Lentisphaerota bacterium]